MQPLPTIASACQHCGETVPNGLNFCCAGCESVHALLVARGLSHFYTLRKQYSFAKPSDLRSPSTRAQEYQGEEAPRKQTFYLEGIHCLGCLWLLEKLPEIDPRISSSSLDSAHHLLDLEITANTTWRETIALISELGYSAKPVSIAGATPLRAQDSRRQLGRIGIAGFSAGNIMLLSVSVYAGTDPLWSFYFEWLSFALAIPVLTYCAWPIYKAAFFPLRKGRLSVDLAIALALVAGAIMSLWSLVGGTKGQVYFDSLSMLVFLLLSSRYLLMKFRESLAKDGNFLNFLGKEKYFRVSPAKGPVSASKIMPGDEILVSENQALPTDAILLAPKAHFDLSLLTGESLPITSHTNDRLEAGAVLRSPSAHLRVERKASESRLALILENIKSTRIHRSPSVDFADRLGKYFVAAAILGSLLILRFAPHDDAMRRALALVIVTCPCVLAFAVPLAFTKAMQIAARKGILFVESGKIEELAKLKNIFLDKTGTLTTGTFEVLEWHNLGERGEESVRAALALEATSLHPVGKAIARYCAERGIAPVAAATREIPGYGVFGEFEGRTWRIGKSSRPAHGKNRVEILADEKLEAEVILGDSPREDSWSVVRALQAEGISLAILSGDNAENVSGTATHMGIPRWHANLTPEGKAKILGQAKNCAMVGDGANDAIAFQAANTGIAVQGCIELGLRNSDLVLTRPGLRGVLEAYHISRKAMRVVRLNFAVTLTYNILAGSLAALGLMQPLWAAVLMPLSALSVFAITQWRLREDTP